MHVAERIALWTVIGLIIFFLFFKNSSGFTASQPNLMNLAEFSWLPSQVKSSYVSNGTAIVTKLGTLYSSMSASEKTDFQNYVIAIFTLYKDGVNSATSLKQLFKKGDNVAPVVFAGPQVEPGQVNMAAAQAQPNVTQASPVGVSGGVAMASVQAATQSFPNNKVSVYPGTNFTGNVTFFEPSVGPIAFTPSLNVGSIYVPLNYKIEYKQASGSTGVIVGESKIWSTDMKITQLQVKN